MATQLVVNVTNPDDILTLFGADALIRGEWGTTSAMLDASEFGTEPVVAGTFQYEIEHAAGTSALFYRFRYSRASPSIAADYSGYSDAVLYGTQFAYATLDELLGSFDSVVSSSRHRHLSELLVSASAYIDDKCGRRFYRNPQVTGTGTFTFPVRYPGRRRLSAALGYGIDIVSVTSLTLADSTGDTPVAVAAGVTGYYLEPGDGQGTAGTVWPYEDMLLSDEASNYYSYPWGVGTIVTIVGVLGFPAVPQMVKQATIDLAREWYRQGPGGGAPSGGVSGQPMFSSGVPHSVYSLYALGSPYRKTSWATI